MNLLEIDAKRKSFGVREVNELGPVERAVKHYKEGVKKNIFSFGTGPLSFTNIPGLHRLIFANKSRLWDGFFISTMGGASIPLTKAGLNYVEVRGKCGKLSIVKIKNFGKLEVEFEEVPEEELEKIFNGYEGKKGVRALQQYVHDNDSKGYIDSNAVFRIIAVGPAALKTDMGVLCSTQIQGGKFLEGLDSWAGRGGFGSTLVKDHNIIAIIYGGSCKPEPPPISEVNALFEKTFQKGMTDSIMEVTKKYRYDPAFNSGGTFGVNFSSLKSWFVSFNWSSVNLPEAKRQEMYDKWITGHYLKQFNDEIIEPRSFKTCGEPCPVVCKKYQKEGSYKKDYEPYEANGPNSGIFDQRAAEKLVEHVDTLGFDAIELGNMVSWIMEMLHKGIMKKEDYGLSRDPKFDPDDFKLLEDSMHNAELGVEIVSMVMDNETFQKGIRNAAKKLGEEAMGMAVYNPHCKGSITPCMYWVPAFFLPIAVQGKFLSDYSLKFRTPRQLGIDSTERMIKEMYSDNLGACRFHRQWLEKIAQGFVKEFLKKEMDIYEYSKDLVRQIYRLSPCSPEGVWESERVYDIIKTYLEKLYAEEKGNKELKEWVERFRKDKLEAGKEYWNEVIKGIEEDLR